MTVCIKIEYFEHLKHLEQVIFISLVLNQLIYKRINVDSLDNWAYFITLTSYFACGTHFRYIGDDALAGVMGYNIIIKMIVLL